MSARPAIVIGVTQRVERLPHWQERRDTLDQRWLSFLDACGLIALPLPNHLAMVESLAPALNGVLLTGGGDILALGGDAPERDAVEAWLIAQALAGRWPLLGVCRGMQALVHAAGGSLGPVAGHVGQRHPVTGPWVQAPLSGTPLSGAPDAAPGAARQVNSYHNFAAITVAPPLEIKARSIEGVIEAVGHATLPVAGLMWHPEREDSPDPRDIALFRRLFTPTVPPP